MKNFLSFTIVVFCYFAILADVNSQGITVSFDIKNYDNDTLIVGNYFGEKQIVKDTLFSKTKGKFTWKAEERPAQGVYLILMKPENTFIQFMVNDTESKFSLQCNAKDLNEIKFKDSPENEYFYDYMAFLRDKRILADTLKARIERAKESNTEDKVSQDGLDKLDKDVKKYQNEFINKHPKSLTAMLIKANLEIEVPEFEGHEDTVKLRRYYYYKKHYFDNINMDHPALIRTPFIHPKVDYYLNKVSNQQPDSLIKTVDIILSKLENNPEAYRYYLADLLNKYASMKMVGYDALYVHLIDAYYKKGKATWVTDDNLKKMGDNADDLRPILIGKKIPDITTYKEDGSPVRLWDIKSPYTVVIFWAPDCGHCKKIMPDVVKFYKNNKDKGVKMLGICTKGGDKTSTCWPAVKEKGMEDFINTADEYGRYNIKIKIKSTPKIFILDEKKEIIIKDIPGEELDRIFNEILTFEEKKRAEKNGKIEKPVETTIVEEKIENSKIEAQKKSKVVKGSGTGFLISLDGYIATNYHVIDGADSIELIFMKGLEKIILTGKVVEKDILNDIAIIKTNLQGLNFKNLPYEISSNYQMGDEVFTIGVPDPQRMGEETKFTKGDISSTSGSGLDKSVMQITTPIQPGSSGSPLFNISGDIIGITTATLEFDGRYLPQNVNYAIKSEYLTAILKNIPKSGKNIIKTLSMREKVNKLKEYVCLINVY